MDTNTNDHFLHDCEAHQSDHVEDGKTRRGRGRQSLRRADRETRWNDLRSNLSEKALEDFVDALARIIVRNHILGQVDGKQGEDSECNESQKAGA